MLFAILQKYDFSSKSQLSPWGRLILNSCLRYCKSTIFQANHNVGSTNNIEDLVVCDTAKVRFFKQITTRGTYMFKSPQLFAILQKYDFSSKSQPLLDEVGRYACCLRYCKSTIFQANHNQAIKRANEENVVCDTAKVRFFKQITTVNFTSKYALKLFAILQKYDFSSKSQHIIQEYENLHSCLRYCKSTIFQANHNTYCVHFANKWLFAILQKYDFSSKSQLFFKNLIASSSCLRYCKSTIFQANHNWMCLTALFTQVVCDTAKVRFFKQITTGKAFVSHLNELFAILQKYDFSSKSQQRLRLAGRVSRCLRYCKSTIFQANHNKNAPLLFLICVVCDTAKVRFFKQITTWHVVDTY